MSRCVIPIIAELTAFNPATASDDHRLAHSCYMVVVGQVEDPSYLSLLDDMIKYLDEDNVNSNKVDDSLAIMECEEVEIMLQHMTLDYTIDELNNLRQNHFVFEDNFNMALISHLNRSPSYEKLKHICHKYEGTSENDAKMVISEHERIANQSHGYFMQRGLSEDDARASAFAITFYTGTKSELCSRGASLITRQANGTIIEDKTINELQEASIILYYLVKGLSYIPYYWGYATRSCQLNSDELKRYVAGTLITWLQFSSSTKGKQVAEGCFTTRNTVFKIYSLTGRKIQDFSNYDYEDEVLFLPHSTFLILKHVPSEDDTQHTIYMRQVELGLSSRSILWVDDKIFNENWENKSHMEYASAKALNSNVHFIPKSSTDTAMSFLRSPFGQRLKNERSFRIVSDMTRKNEDPSHNAGARLVKQLRQLGFENDLLIYTSDLAKAYMILENELTSNELKNVDITIASIDLHRFINFD